MNIYLSHEANADLDEIWDYLVEDSLRQADRLIARIVATCEKLATFPEMGKKRDELLTGLRTFPVNHYLIFYRIHEDAIEIVRILSGYRDIDTIFE